MFDESTLNDIQELNLTYLLLAQKLIKGDLSSALIMLDITPDMAVMISSLKVGEIMELSRLNQLICSLRHVDEQHMAAIVRKDRDQGLNSVHAALVFSSPSKGSLLEKVSI